MAKLGTYFGLCPLIDQKSLLGVSEDETLGYVIVTLGKNMAIKYKLCNQKQILSWSTKEKLTSPVVYDKKQDKYVAVFNQHYLRIWNKNEINLDKIKKIKFSEAINTIVSCEFETLILFKSGQILPLNVALEKRKVIEPNNMNIFKSNSSNNYNYTCIKINNEYFIGTVVYSNSNYSYMWTKLDGVDIHKNVNFNQITLTRNGLKLNGHVVVTTESGPVLYTLWSDGRLYVQNLDGTEQTANFFSVIDSVSRHQIVCLLALNSSYLAIYGADVNQEGASLQIYNLQFKITQSSLQLKLYSSGSKLWLINNNILLTIGQNLAVVPFYLETEQLGTLVGSHKLLSNMDNKNDVNDYDDDIKIVTEMLQKQWKSKTNNNKFQNKISSQYSTKSDIKFLINEGWSETSMGEDILPNLIKTNNVTSILMFIDHFKDVSEHVLVNLIAFCVRRIKGTCNDFDIMKKRVSGQNGRLLDILLTIPYNDVILLQCLRTGLQFDEMLIFLQYICYLFSKNGHVLPLLNPTKSEQVIIDWAAIIIDSFYQQLLLSKNSHILEYIKIFQLLLDSYFDYLNELKIMQPILNQLIMGKNTKTKIQSNKFINYSIEKLKII